jgi:multiple sugar transport system ATP-binding protein
MTLADKIVVLRDGLVEQVGTPRELYERPDNLFVAQFIGSPKMNILPIGSVAGALPAHPYRASHVGMRPEDLELTDPGSGLVSGRVLLSEYTGASSLLHVELPDGEVFLVAYDSQMIDADTTVGLTIAPDRLHFFDVAGRRAN